MSSIDNNEDPSTPLVTTVQTQKRLLLSNLERIGPSSSVQLILASKSPRRCEILDMMGLKNRYVVIPSPLDESALQIELSTKNLKAEKYTQILAERKAVAVGPLLLLETTPTNTNKKMLVLGSDTIVEWNGIILEKPTSCQHAVTMLSQLSGNFHNVYTGVALYYYDQQQQISSSPSLEHIISFTETALVKFATITIQDIQAYVDTKEPMDKAGAYGIQGMGGQFVERIEGDFFTVMGLPMHRTSQAISNALDTILSKKE